MQNDSPNDIQPSTPKTLAVFDFDGTLTGSDSLFHFLYFMCGIYRLFTGAIILLPVFTGMKTGRISNSGAKEKILEYFFKGCDQEDFDHKSRKFAQTKLPAIMRTNALEKLYWHKDHGHEVVVVSASLENYLVPWCDRMGVNCIGTKLLVRDGKIAGSYNGRNCYGPEKARRLKSAYELDQFNRIYVYGDSRGDREILELATDQFYRYFN